MSFRTPYRKMPHLHPPSPPWAARWVLLSIVSLLVLVMSLQGGTGAVFASSTPVLVASPSGFNANTGCTYSLGHGWTCTATLSRSDQVQQNLKWSAFASGISGIIFTPHSGVLAPGATQSVSISVPDTVCPRRATLSFKGPGNTVQLMWSCAGPLLTVDTTDFTEGVNCPAVQGGWTCSTNVGESSSSQGSLKWSVKTRLSGVTFTPSGGTLTPGASTAVSIFVPTSACKNSTFTFTGQNSNIIYALWNCKGPKPPPPPPTLTVSPTSLDPTNTTNCALDATLSATYKCTITLGETSSSRGNANWLTSSSLSGVTFSPASGTLSPGGSTQVTIDVIPCQNGTFTFSGKEGEMPVAVAWSCTPPTLTASPTSLNQNSSSCSASGNTYQCTVSLGESSTSQGNVNWAASSDLNGVSFSPSNGTLSPGQSATITISSIPCQNGTFTFNGSGGANAVQVSWSCMAPPPPPTLTVSPTSLDPTNTTNCALDAFSSATYQCTVTLGETAGSQGNANWSTSSSLNGVTFTPSTGSLQPGGSVSVTIDQIPCQNGTFTFSGSEGETPVSVTWSCTPPTLTVSPTSLNNAMCSGSENASQCTVTLGETSTSQGNVNWSASSSLNGVSLSPASGTLSPGNSATVTISSIPCQNGSFTFSGSGGASPVSVTWMCANWPMFGYDPQHTHFNPNEHGLSTSNVSGLIADWQKPTGSLIGYSSPAVVNNLVYIGSGDGNLYALNATSGAVVWSYYVASPTSPAEANGLVYVGSQDHNSGLNGLYALDAQTGALIWKNNSDWFGPPTVANGVVYAEGDSGAAAFDATSGAIKWQYPAGVGAGDTVGSPAVDNGVVFIASGDKNVYALDATTGALLWSYNDGYPTLSTPAVDSGAVYVTLGNSVVIALNASTGALLWRDTFPNRGADNSSPAVVNGVVYTSTSGVPDQLYALDATTGAVLWQTAVINSESSPAVTNGVIYVGSSDHNVYAFDASNGTKLWSSTTGGQVPSSPAVVNGVVYIGSNDGIMYAFHLPGTTP